MPDGNSNTNGHTVSASQVPEPNQSQEIGSNTLTERKAINLVKREMRNRCTEIERGAAFVNPLFNELKKQGVTRAQFEKAMAELKKAGLGEYDAVVFTASTRQSLASKLMDELLRHSTMTTEEVERTALNVTPLPTRKEVNESLDKLVENGWAFNEDGFISKCDEIARNALRISPNKHTKKALKALADVHWRNDYDDMNNVAEIVLLVALQHPEQVSRWIDKLIRYSSREGLNQKNFLYKDIEAKAETFQARIGTHRTKNESEGL